MMTQRVSLAPLYRPPRPRDTSRPIGWRFSLNMLRALLLPSLSLLALTVHADDALSPATLARIRNAAMNSSYAYSELAILTDQIGGRLAGSPQAQAAVIQTAAALKQLGLNVGLLPVLVPHWIRGAASATLIDYPGRPAGVTQPITVAALGDSPPTPKQGLTARLLVVHDFDDLQMHAAQVRGRVVLFDVPFDQHLADNGYANTAYRQVALFRNHGPAAAARLGAVAALVSSAGGGDPRLPHVGMTLWSPDGRHIPCAAVSAADVSLIDQLVRQGSVRLHLLLTPSMLPPLQSHDVLADLPGRDLRRQVVIISGHLDSWDLATGAQDDAVGVAVAMGVAAVFHQLDLHPRRTLRVVAWMNEEDGLSGARAYREALVDSLPYHVAAMESDNGSGRPLGIAARILPQDAAALAPVFDALRPLGATILTQLDKSPSADIAPLVAAGVPGFAPLVDTRHYYDVHHSAADTLEHVDPLQLRRQVAVMAVLAWWLCNADAPQRLPVATDISSGGD